MKGASKALGLGAKYLLELSENFLTRRDLCSCRSYALEVEDLRGELRGKWGRNRREEGDEGDGKREGEGEIK
ncbi:hypothetical protein FH972_014143 [Carpinus fangiana]|uniref:Uncharacterized protein n=1 Tax=Carpinus fangiana TaxID=176857 RepID=A0A5N6R8T6_9ROSI|nr:hypothetical protein FH972_014143 [Carpinus fangiana]